MLKALFIFTAKRPLLNCQAIVWYSSKQTLRNGFVNNALPEQVVHLSDVL